MRANAGVALGGALGGGINAWLCYAGLPVAVTDAPTFAWHVVPAGAVHGAVLALAAFAAAMFFRTQPLRTRLAVALPVAWVAGFMAWIPLNRSAFEEPWLKSFAWALDEGWGRALLGPLEYFGFVALLYYLAVALWPSRQHSLAVHVGIAGVAGTVGSLWWWVNIGPWYFCVLHGAIWGTLVGAGAWAARRLDVGDSAA